jgi:hypothetical protein
MNLVIAIIIENFEQSSIKSISSARSLTLINSKKRRRRLIGGAFSLKELLKCFRKPNASRKVRSRVLGQRQIRKAI